MKYIIFILISLFGGANVMAQSSLRIAPKSSNTKSDAPKDNKAQFQKKIEPDSVYCIQTKKQHGWFSPLYTIKAEDVTRYSSVYKFSRKNAAGNWSRMEILDSHGQPIAGNGRSPYILKISSAETDSTANKDWVENLKKACVYEFIADPSGKDIIQERAYDKYHNIIYTYSRVPIGKNKFIGSYKDIYGLPAEMRNDPGYTYGTCAMITEDRWGNDSIVEYIDAKGLRKLNSDNVAMEVYVCDRYGRLIRQMSCDSIGNRTIDNWGNCGIEYVWNKKHQLESAMYMDADWKPMRMPQKREVGTRDNVIKTVYKCDDYGRQIEEKFVTADGENDTNSFGAHRIVYTYDDHGNTVKQEVFNIDGLPAVADASLTSINEWQYDNKGRMTDARYLDKSGKPCSTEGYLSRQHLEYDEEGNEIAREYYKMKDGEEVVSFRQYTQKNYYYKQWSDGSYRIDSLDAKGRTTLTAFYDKDGKLENVGEWAMEKTVYVDEPQKIIGTEQYFDKDLKLVDIDNVSYTIFCSDSVTRSLSKLRYTSNHNLYESFIFQFDDNFKELQGQYDMNRFGVICRAGGASGVCCYYAKVFRTGKGVFSSFIGKDEFDEPDYIFTSSLIYYYQKMSSHGNNVFYDENNAVIEDFYTFKDQCPKAMSIEVIDSCAYNLGIKDNDIILQYGNYKLDYSLNDHNFKSYWALYSALEASKKKTMVVFRIDPSSKKCSIETIELPDGTPIQLGFIPHCIYRTQKQTNRLLAVLKKHIEDNNQPDLKSLLDFKRMEGHKEIVVAYPEMYRDNRTNPYPAKVGDPSILLCLEQGGKSWNFGEDVDILGNIIKSRRNKTYLPILSYYLSKDGSHVEKVDFPEPAVHCYIKAYNVSDEEYAQVQKLYKAAVDIKSANTKKVQKLNYSGLSKSELDSLYNVAFGYYLDDFGEESFAMFAELAKVGYPAAYSMLSSSYTNGLGVKEDLKAAEKWARKAQKEGYYLGIYSLGNKYRRDKNFVSAGKYYQECIKDKSSYKPESYYQLAEMQLKGEGCEVDTLKAIHYYNDCIYEGDVEQDSVVVGSAFRQLIEIGANYKKIAVGFIYLGIKACNMDDYNSAYQLLSSAMNIQGNLVTEKIDATPYMYMALQSLKNQDEAQYQAPYEDFMKDKVFMVAMVEGEDTPARKQGLSGSYYIMEYGDWNIHNDIGIYTVNNALKGHPKSIVIMKDDEISKHHFEDTIGCQILIQQMSQEEKERIIQKYDSWNRNNLKN